MTVRSCLLSRLAIAVAAAVGAIVPADAAVFGSDDRVPLPAELKPLEDRIGFLFNTPARSVCTAFCVADDAVATAAHCLYRTSGEPMPRISDFRFSRAKDAPGRTTGVAGYTTGSAAQNVLAGSMRLSVRPPIEATRDWAIVRLAAPVCRGRALKLRAAPPEELAVLSRERKVFQVAYHRDLATWQLAYSKPCEALQDTPRASWSQIARDFVAPEQLILHECDTGAASSGSPILVDTPDGPEVVGINVGTYVQSRVMMQGEEIVHRFKSDTIANTGVNVSAFADRMEEFLGAQVLRTAPEIKALQSGLRRRLLYAGALDGVYGPELRAAIEAFETSAGRPITGAATRELLTTLASAGNALAQNLPTRAETGPRTTRTSALRTAARRN